MDPIGDAERQMAEHELAAVKGLIAKAMARIGFDLDHPPTDDEMNDAIRQLIEEDPEARELARAAATFIQFRKLADDEEE